MAEFKVEDSRNRGSKHDRQLILLSLRTDSGVLKSYL